MAAPAESTKLYSRTICLSGQTSNRQWPERIASE